jgi:UDP-N-acetylmuramate--alanine ligase
MSHHLHVIGIGGIGISALARYYHSLGYHITGSDQSDSSLIITLRSEGMEITIGHDADLVTPDTELIIYSEAIISKPDLSKEDQLYANPELARAREYNIRHISYPEALAEVVNQKQCIAISGSHGKSTTTAMTAIMFAGSPLGANAIMGTQVPQLGNSNFHAEDSEYFIIEACEYKRAFLRYRPYITVITNIDLDHLDYYKDLDEYISAFQSLVDQTERYVIISADDEHSLGLTIPEHKKVIVGNGAMQYYCKPDKCEVFRLPPLLLQIP